MKFDCLKTTTNFSLGTITVNHVFLCFSRIHIHYLWVKTWPVFNRLQLYPQVPMPLGPISFLQAIINRILWQSSTIPQMNTFCLAENLVKLFFQGWSSILNGSSGGSLDATPDCETAVLGADLAISPAYSGLPVLRWAANWDGTLLKAVLWGVAEENIQ